MKFVTAFVGSARRAPSGEPREITGRVESLSKGALTLESGQVRPRRRRSSSATASPSSVTR